MPIRDFDKNKARSRNKTNNITGICLNIASEYFIECSVSLSPLCQCLLKEKANPRTSVIVISNNPAK